MSRSTPQPWRMPTGYLNGPLYDHILIFGVLLLAVITGFLVQWKPSIIFTVLFADFWLLGHHHVISTFTKLAGTKQDRIDNKFLIYQLPFIVIALVFAIYQLFGAWVIVSIYFFWQWFHYTRQAYGISVFYNRKAGIQNTITPPVLDYIAIWAMPTWGLLHRCAQGSETFLFQPFWAPHVPSWVDVSVGAVVGILLSFWFATKIIDWSRGNLARSPFFFTMSHHIIFFIGYIYNSDMTLGWLVANIWHNSQYILFVWLFNQNRFQNVVAKEQSPIWHWLCQKSPYRTLAYFAVCVGLTTILYNSLSMGIDIVSGGNAVKFATLTIILYQTINFHHYIVDSLIWKAREKNHQRIMKIHA